MVQAAIDGQPRPLAAAFYLMANAPVNRFANYCSIRVCHSLISNFRLPIANELFARLSWLQLDRHAGVANAFSFVSVRLAKLMHLCSDLPELLLINARQRQRRLILMPAGTGVFKLPFGPLTSSICSPMVTETPFGNVITFLPMRDIISP